MMVGGRGACGVQLRLGAGGVPTSQAEKGVLSGLRRVPQLGHGLDGRPLGILGHARPREGRRRVPEAGRTALRRALDPDRRSVPAPRGPRRKGACRATGWPDGWKARGEVFTGVHPECRGTAGLGKLRLYPSAVFPLLLLQEAEVGRFGELGLLGRPADGQAQLRISGRRAELQSEAILGGGGGPERGPRLHTLLVIP